jgi:hypothetical protein
MADPKRPDPIRSDLEPVGAILPRVFQQIAQTSEDHERDQREQARRELSAAISAATPHSNPQPDPEIRAGEWQHEPMLRRWPVDLIARLIQAVDTMRTLDIDNASEQFYDVIGELLTIDRAAERGQ